MIVKNENITSGPSGNIGQTGSVVIPSGADLTKLNQAGLNMPPMPNLQVFTPDYGSLEKSFQDILSSYQGYKQAAQGQYEAQKASLGTNLQQQMQTIGTAKQENKQALAKSQAQLAQDVFMLNRQTQAAASARGLSGSGVEAMANIQNRMAAGEKISDMANEYFDAQTQLVQAEQATRQNYDNSLQNLNASLQSAMAQIMSQEASTKMDYTQTVENLKRQVIADTNAMKQAQYEWQVANEQYRQGATITESMIAQKAAQGDEAGLRDLGMNAAQARQAVLDARNKAMAENEAAVYAGYQQEIDNYRSEKKGTSDAAVKKFLVERHGSGVINFEKLELGGTGTGMGTRTATGGGTLFGGTNPWTTAANAVYNIPAYQFVSNLSPSSGVSKQITSLIAGRGFDTSSLVPNLQGLADYMANYGKK